MKMVQCEKCGKIYPNNISNCPECFEKNKKYISKGRKTLGIIILILGVFLFIGAVINWDDTSINNSDNSSIFSMTQNNTESSTNNEGRVNYENFEKIENEMTYEQVVKIFGEDGKVLSQTDVGLGEEYSSIMYYWYDETGIANCNVMFQGGKVIAKAQVGLK